MKLKKGVDWRHVHPRLWSFLELADDRHQEITGQEMIVTSLRREWRAGNTSKHSPPPDVPCAAADIRRWALDGVSFTADFCRWLQTLGVGVLLEPDWMTEAQIAARGGLDKIAPHIHVQLRESAIESGFEWTD
jgi:hypothetical protein